MDIDNVRYELSDLQKADQTHAEKKVQVAADQADETLDGELRLLLHHRVLERLVEDRHAQQVLVQLAHAREVRLIDVRGDETLIAVEANVLCLAVGRILIEGQGGREHALLALERTPRPALIIIEPIGAHLLIAAQTPFVVVFILAFFQPHSDIIVETVALLGRLLLSAQQQTRAPTVGIIERFDLFDQRRRCRRIAQEFIFAVEAALAVGVRPLVELRVEGALDVYLDTETGREQDGRRRRRSAERILGAVVNVEIEASRASCARAPVIRQASVEIELEAIVEVAGDVDADQVALVAAYRRIEAIAVVLGRMPDPLEVARVAQGAANQAVDNDHVERVAQRLLERVAHVGARAVVGVELECEHVRGVGGQRELCSPVGGQLVDRTQGDGRKDGRLLLIDAALRRHLVVHVLVDGADDECHAHGHERGQDERPDEAYDERVRAQDVRQSVHFQQLHVLLDLLQPM